jgi:CHASE3 domain sensor protein
MKQSVRNIILGFGLVFVILFTAGVVSYRNVSDPIENQRLIIRNNAISTKLQHILSDLSDASDDVATYGLTGD